MYQSVLYSLQAYLPIHILEAVMSEEKNGSYKGLTEARRRANKKYNDRFVEIKVRVTPEKFDNEGPIMDAAVEYYNAKVVVP